MPERVRKLLEQIGDNRILKIQLGRTPVLAALTILLNILSSGKFNNKKIELGYDEIYHNYLLINVEVDKKHNVIQSMAPASQNTVPSKVYKLEKAHRVRLMDPSYPAEFTDIYNIPLTPTKVFTLNRLISTASNVDKQFYTYDAGDNNMCQTFVENILDINGLTSNIVSNATRLALKPQDARALIATLGSRSDIVKFITDLGGKIDKMVFDNKIVWKKPVKKEFTLIGNMVVKVQNVTRNRTDGFLSSPSYDIQVEGMTDAFIENTDDAFRAILRLEENEKEASKKRMISIIIIVVVVIIVIGIATAVGYFIWKKRNGVYSTRWFLIIKCTQKYFLCR